MNNTDTLQRAEMSEKEREAGMALEDIEDPPPDGGYGWVCSICVCLLIASSWGTNAAFGVYLAFFLDNDYFKNATSVDYAMMGGLVICLAELCSPFVIILVKRIGFKTTLMSGALLQLACYIGASFSKDFASFFITQGFLLGIAYSLVFSAASLVLPSWFLIRRGLAQGIATAGAGVGGVIYSQVSSALIRRTGDHKWALRTVGILSMFINCVCILLVKPRKPLKREESIPLCHDLKEIIDIKVCKQTPVILVTLWFSVYSLGYTIVLYSLSSFASSLGLSRAQGFTITTILGVGQAFGRPSIGFLSDKAGRINFSILMATVVAIFTFCFWIFSSSYGELIACSLLLGLTIGYTWVNYIPILADALGPSACSSGWKFANVIGGLVSLVAELIGLELRNYTLSKPYLYCQIFSGLTSVVCVLILLPLREWKVRSILCGSGKENAALAPGVRGYLARMFYPIKA